MRKVALGIDIGGMSIKSAFMDEEGTISQKFVLPVPKGEDQYVTMNRLIDACKVAIANLPEGNQLVGIGCGVPGANNTFTGFCDYSNNLGWRNLPVASLLEKALGYPVKIDNDANAAMLGEIKFGCAKRYHNAVLITIGTGIGGGLYLDDHLYVGNQGKGAELGHMVIVDNGIPCTCGRKGCLESYASATALLRMTKEAMEKHPESLMWRLCPDMNQVGGALPFEAAKKGDAIAQEVLDTYIHYLGEGCLNFANIFRPEAIILAGGVSKQGENLRRPLAQYLEDRGYGFGTGLVPKVDILISKLGADMGIYGAGALGFDVAK